MGPKRRNRSSYLKPTGYGLSALAAGVLLLWLSALVNPTKPGSSQTTTSAPAENPTPDDPATVAAENLSGLLGLFGLICLALTAICAGWLVINVRKSRPAWKTQTKYPRKR